MRNRLLSYQLISRGWLSLLLLALTFGVAENSFAQFPNEITVEIGKPKLIRTLKDVDASSVRVVVEFPSFARAGFDENLNRFRIEGLSEGTTRITFSGTYRRLVVGGRITQQAVPFRETVVVQVLPALERADVRTLQPRPVSVNDHQDTKLEYFMGPAFAKKNEEGVRWRNVRVYGGISSIAKGFYDNNQMMVRIYGFSNGKTIFVLRGERFINRAWQPVIRNLEITVGTGVSARNRPPADANPDRDNPPPEQPAYNPKDDWLLNINEKRHHLFRKSMEDGSLKPDPLAIRELENMVAQLEQEMETEKRRNLPRAERLRRLEDLRDKVDADAAELKDRLKDDKPPIEAPRDANSSLTGNWRKFSNGRDSGVFRIVEAGGQVTMTGPGNSTEKGFEGTRRGQIIRGKCYIAALEFSFSCEMRAEPGLKELKAWGTSIRQVNGKYEEYGELEFRGTTYFREER